MNSKSVELLGAHDMRHALRVRRSWLVGWLVGCWLVVDTDVFGVGIVFLLWSKQAIQQIAETKIQQEQKRKQKKKASSSTSSSGSSTTANTVKTKWEKTLACTRSVMYCYDIWGSHNFACHPKGW